MIVEKIMNEDIITLTPADTIHSAVLLIKEKRIRHIPIVDDCFQLVGLVSDRDIRDAVPSIFNTAEYKNDLQKPLSSIMKTDLITGHPLDFVEEIGAVFCENSISCLPIVKERKLVGIITGSDLLQSFVELTGVNQPGSQIEIKIPNKAGTLHDIAHIFKRRNSNILSTLVYPEKDGTDYKILVIRVQTMNPFMVVEDLKQEGYTVLWPSLPGTSHE
ncbi:CBS domain-containing protein [Peribacillus muralis]|uniref:acetoin utilization AcuB family protein n=1 Tax=Peribacillus muralis TaxID=264697 RepID=UPI001F4DD18C|nr:acetoin utilization AcuB family protein [Peribacillus muralis]MCK1991879.1 acetoin utilization AcuB family protein [Peribacillus muralis]MCK2012437.1 acetoin utilization AcuB family protein [Peribacillus muralis]